MSNNQAQGLEPSAQEGDAATQDTVKRGKALAFVLIALALSSYFGYIAYVGMRG